MRITIAFVRRMLVLALMLALTNAVGLYSTAPTQAQSAQVTVSIQVSTGTYGYQNISFNPPSVTVPVGGKVTWSNGSNSSVAVSSAQASFSTTIPAGGSFSFIFNTAGNFSVSAQAGDASATMGVTVTTSAAQAEEVQEFALIHSLKDLKIYPATLIVKKGVKVRLFNTATDGSHPAIAISSDQDGKNAVFGVQPFDVEVGKLMIVEFIPTQAGSFFITHKPHGHPIEGQLIVKEEK